jgi:hypothetical protein
MRISAIRGDFVCFDRSQTIPVGAVFGAGVGALIGFGIGKTRRKRVRSSGMNSSSHVTISTQWFCCSGFGARIYTREHWAGSPLPRYIWRRKEGDEESVEDALAEKL